MAQTPDSQSFVELKIFYPWLGDNHLALLQTMYQTWGQLAKADSQALVRILSGIPRPPETPGITLQQVGIIKSFAQEKVRLQEKGTT